MTGTFHLFDQPVPFFDSGTSHNLVSQSWMDGSVLFDRQYCSWGQIFDRRVSDFVPRCVSMSLSLTIGMWSIPISCSSGGYVSNIAVSTWIVPVRPGASQGRIVIWITCSIMNVGMRVQTLLSSERMAYNLGYATGRKNVMFEISLISLNLYLSRFPFLLKNRLEPIIVSLNLLNLELSLNS